MLFNNLVYKRVFQEIESNSNQVFMFSMTSFFSGFSTGSIFDQIEPILGSLSPLVPGDASNVADNMSVMYFRSFTH